MVIQFKALLLGIFLALPIGTISIAFSKKINLMDYPGRAVHKIHAFPVPIAGGITLIVSSSILFFCLRADLDSAFFAIFLPALIIFFFGLLDDIVGLSAPWKLLGQFLAALVLMRMGISIHLFEHLTSISWSNSWEFLPSLIDAGLTIFWTIGIVNAFNLVDSMDGLVSGLSAWAFGFFMVAGMDSQQSGLSVVAAAFLGINLVLSFYNTSPARLFLGDSGAQTLGFVLAAIAIVYSPIYLVQASSWFVPILVFAVPIFDTSLVFFSRMRRHTPFYVGNLDHTYHRLVHAGIDSQRAVFCMHLTALFFECLALVAASWAPLHSNLLFWGCLVLGIGIFFFLDQPKFLPNQP